MNTLLSSPQNLDYWWNHQIVGETIWFSHIDLEDNTIDTIVDLRIRYWWKCERAMKS
jgi:hypothetical protein